MTAKVLLSDDDKQLCWAMAKRTSNQAKLYGFTKSCYNNKQDPRRDFVGYCGELAFEKLFNLNWHSPLKTNYTKEQLQNKELQLPDFENDIEIRTIDKPNNSLLFREWDKTHYSFVLMYVDPKTSWAHCLGFKQGHLCKDKKYYWQGVHNKPCYYIPQKDLEPICNLWPISKYVPPKV